MRISLFRFIKNPSCCGARNLCAALTAASRPLPGAPAFLGCAGFPDDRCHSLLLASSAAGGARNRPPLHHIRVGLSVFMDDAAGIEPASHGCAHRASSNARPCHCQTSAHPGRGNLISNLPDFHRHGFRGQCFRTSVVALLLLRPTAGEIAGGGTGRTRTGGLLIPNQARYPSSLLLHIPPSGGLISAARSGTWPASPC